MKTMINFSTSPDDTSRYTSSEDLQGFYTSFDCDGLELMPLEDPDTSLIRPEMVIDAACDLINALLDGQDYSFDFLMENLWWPGLNFLYPSVTKRLLEGVHYPNKGLMLDTGHFLHTNTELRTQKEALDYLSNPC